MKRDEILEAISDNSSGYMATKSSAQWNRIHHSTDIAQTDANLEVRHLVFK